LDVLFPDVFKKRHIHDVVFQLDDISAALFRRETDEDVNQKQMWSSATGPSYGDTPVDHPQMSPPSVVLCLVNTSAWFSRWI